MKERTNSDPHMIPLIARRWRGPGCRRLPTSLVLVGVVAVFALTVVFVNSRPSSAEPPAHNSSAQPTNLAMPNGLSVSGKLLYRFEDFLHQKYGSTPVSVLDTTRHRALEIVACSGGCGPLAAYDPYFDTFTMARGLSGLSISTLQYADQSFGNYPIPLAVGGHLIACNSAKTMFLVMLADAISFTLDCVPPLNG
jgi:hypothetical protein